MRGGRREAGTRLSSLGRRPGSACDWSPAEATRLKSAIIEPAMVRGVALTSVLVVACASVCASLRVMRWDAAVDGEKYEKVLERAFRLEQSAMLSFADFAGMNGQVRLSESCSMLSFSGPQGRMLQNGVVFVSEEQAADSNRWLKRFKSSFLLDVDKEVSVEVKGGVCEGAGGHERGAGGPTLYRAVLKWQKDGAAGRAVSDMVNDCGFTASLGIGVRVCTGPEAASKEEMEDEEFRAAADETGFVTRKADGSGNVYRITELDDTKVKVVHNLPESRSVSDVQDMMSSSFTSTMVADVRKAMLAGCADCSAEAQALLRGEVPDGKPWPYSNEARQRDILEAVGDARAARP